MQNIFLTGGTDGIGLSATKSLLDMNNRLFVTYRNEKKLAGVKSELKPYVYDKQISFLKCDLSELSEIAEVVKAVTKSDIKIDCLINNAGTILFKKSYNSMGIEKVFATNHIGPFYLTNCFLKKNIINRGGRIINVGSSAHKSATLDFQDLDSRNSRSWYERYSRSKLCNLLFTFELSKKLSEKKVSVNCLHPGIVNTNIAQEHKGILQFIIRLVLKYRGISSEEGADTLVYLATNEKAKNISGKYFVKRRESKPSLEALREDVAERLWQESMKIIDRFS
ncbi:SDR family NAD(P)-dependent oxidoreductase [Paracoccaceae bacterium]|nr:SDR family NAD(P)-dependent oxidoreductase [Paracoccaceae bacterium]